jgi:hypothetical protein
MGIKIIFRNAKNMNKRKRSLKKKTKNFIRDVAVHTPIINMTLLLAIFMGYFFCRYLFW